MTCCCPSGNPPETQLHGLHSAGPRHPLPGMHQAPDSWGKAGLSIDHTLVQVVWAQGSPLSSSGNSEGLPKSLGHSREPACQAGFSASTWLGLYPSFIQGSHLKCDSERVSESQKHPDWRGNILGTDGLRFAGGLPRNLAGALFRQPTSRSRAVDRKRQKAPVLALVSAMMFLPVTAECPAAVVWMAGTPLPLVGPAGCDHGRSPPDAGLCGELQALKRVWGQPQGSNMP